ncbi:MAG TPA: dipeptidase [Phycisphaerae bacterium]|nr:dipeptidase [Phycisphaerae bacterium]
MIDKTLQYIETNRDRFVELLYDFLRIPSISTDASKAEAMRQAAGWVRQRLLDCDVQAEIVETPGHPVVLADTGPADGAATVLVYGHYDVQPVGDESLWDSPAFEPTLRDEVVYARGAADDKGQVLTHLLSTEAWMKTAGKLPLRLKFLIEGEEEIGSPNLGALVESHRERLACDYVVISDTAKFSTDTPAITYGTKGMVYKEIIVTGPKTDLHSGSFGGTVDNPANVLARIVAGLKDADQRVTIPGFYNDVQSISPQEQAAIDALPFDENDYLQSTGSPALSGEAGFTTLQRRWTRPTLDVNGLYGGFMGQGSSTIIPARVGAKVSMRIVPDQDPAAISEAFDRAVQALTPPGVRVEVRELATAAPYVCPIDSPGMRAAIAAVEAGFNKRPVLIREGGTLPILPLFRSVLGAESLMMGLCVPNCNMHGPNEFFALDDFFCGLRSSACFTHLLAGA